MEGGFSEENEKERGQSSTESLPTIPTGPRMGMTMAMAQHDGPGCCISCNDSIFPQRGEARMR